MALFPTSKVTLLFLKTNFCEKIIKLFFGYLENMFIFGVLKGGKQKTQNRVSTNKNQKP